MLRGDALPRTVQGRAIIIFSALQHKHISECSGYPLKENPGYPLVLGVGYGITCDSAYTPIS
jgi:hypothetical protein